MTANELNTLFINYIEDNKEKHNISASHSLNFLQDVLDEVKREYEEEINNA